MADPNEILADNAAQLVEPANPPGVPAPITLTVETVQAMIAEATKKAHDAGAAAARRALEGKPPKKLDVPPKDLPSGDVAAAEDPEYAESLTDAIGEFSFDKEQRREIRAAARREKPDDVDAFVAKWGRMFGKSTGAQPDTKNNTGALPPNQAAKTAPNPTLPPPAATPNPADGGPVFRALSDEVAQDTWQAYVRRKGADPGNPYSPKNRAVWREMRSRFEGEASISSIKLGARRS